MCQIVYGVMNECTNISLTNHSGIAVDLIHNFTAESHMFFSHQLIPLIGVSLDIYIYTHKCTAFRGCC